MNPHARKFYVRHREAYPETEVMFSAWMGFWTLGVEVAPFHWVDDVKAFDDLGPEVGVCGWLGDVWEGLKKLGRPIPPPLDYPPELKEFLGRDIRAATLGEVRSSVTPTFVKPCIDHKLFTGFVWNADTTSRRRIVTFPDEVPVWVSDPIDIMVEYRSFMLHETVIDCRKYKGDWGIAPDRKVVEAGMRTFKKAAPAAYCLDWGVTKEGETVLVEANDAISFGGYGLPTVSHARMLDARWYELTR